MSKVLVIEDNPLNLKLFEDLLSILKCEVISSTTGKNAYELCKNTNPDLILMDIQLDGISGIDIIKRVKADKLLKKIPLVAISAYALKNEEEKIIDSGCDKYMSKPVSIEDFFDTVKFYLNKENA